MKRFLFFYAAYPDICKVCLCCLPQSELEELGEAENRSRLEKFLKTEAAVSSASQAAQGQYSNPFKMLNRSAEISPKHFGYFE